MGKKDRTQSFKEFIENMPHGFSEQEPPFDAILELADRRRVLSKGVVARDTLNSFQDAMTALETLIMLENEDVIPLCRMWRGLADMGNNILEKYEPNIDAVEEATAPSIILTRHDN